MEILQLTYSKVQLQQHCYADLAEKYTTDKEYPVGTVMAVGGEAETRAAKISDIAIWCNI